MIAFITADDPDDPAEKESLDNSREDVDEFEMSHCRYEEMTHRRGVVNIHGYISAKKSDEVRKNGQQRDHERCGYRTRNNEVAIGVDGGDLHGVDLLGHFHRAQLGAHPRSDLTGTDDRRDHGSYLPDHRNRNHSRYHRNGAEGSHRRPGLNGQHRSHDESRQTDEEGGFIPYEVTLIKDLPPFVGRPYHFFEEARHKSHQVAGIVKERLPLALFFLDTDPGPVISVE